MVHSWARSASSGTKTSGKFRYILGDSLRLNMAEIDTSELSHFESIESVMMIDEIGDLDELCAEAHLLEAVDAMRNHWMN